ncbi:unnamed protein product [Anisakis simplex]|uniref:Uncharacterized protein n=1 Tax=Anisakis simplex TaxID=6269 RepID=A0A0M3JZJ3_ANISI|nr:unnamed protein product [Anisakis simplex]
MTKRYGVQSWYSYRNTHTKSCRPPPSTHKETRSGASRFAFEATPSNSASNESRPALRREGAFYIRRLPQPYQRSKSAAVINDSNDAERAQLTDRADYLASRERIRQLAAGSSREEEDLSHYPSQRRRRMMPPLPPLAHSSNTALDLLSSKQSDYMKASLFRQYSEGNLLKRRSKTSPSKLDTKRANYSLKERRRRLMPFTPFDYNGETALDSLRKRDNLIQLCLFRQHSESSCCWSRASSEFSPKSERRRRLMPLTPNDSNGEMDSMDSHTKRSNHMKTTLLRQFSEGNLLNHRSDPPSPQSTTSTGASPSSGNNSPLVGRYQKNVSADYDTKRRNRIDEIVRRHDIHKSIL